MSTNYTWGEANQKKDSYHRRGGNTQSGCTLSRPLGGAALALIAEPLCHDVFKTKVMASPETGQGE